MTNEDLIALREAIPALLARFDGDERAHLEYAIDQTSDNTCFNSILHLAIEFRGCGAITKSLLLLNWLLDLGINHALVLDNKVRALVDDHRFLEALALLSSPSLCAEITIYKGSAKCLLPHQQSLLEALRGHCLLPEVQVSKNSQLPDTASQDFVLEILRFASYFQEIGDSSRALALLEELMQWGAWCFDALAKDAQILWSILVIQLGANVLTDLSLYHEALACLDASQDLDASWELVKVKFNIHSDCSHIDRAWLSVVEFIVAHPNYKPARAWLVDQQIVPERKTIRETDMAKVKKIDQAIACDSFLIDYFLKLNK